MDNVLKEINKLCGGLKSVLVKELKEAEADLEGNQTSSIKRSIMIRQLIGKNEEEAKDLNLSTSTGIENTEKVFRRMEWMKHA